MIRVWCKCDCGKEKDVDFHTITNGKSRSCGCETANDNRKSPGHANCTVNYHSCKHQAKLRGYVFDLTREEFKNIVTKPCFYCGIEFSKIISGRSNGSFKCNGIDRVNNSIGYIKDNCVPCCNDCNLAKHTL